MENLKEIKRKILVLTREYSRQAHSSFRPGTDELRSEWKMGNPIPYAGRVFTEDEVEAAISTTLDFWLTLGNEGSAMEKELGDFLGAKKCLLVNSGSSANLIAISTVNSHKLPIKKLLNSKF